LVKHEHVVGIPQKMFSVIDKCPACLKGKQHRKSHKSKIINSNMTPLKLLHMDLFGPTNVLSHSKKQFILVVIDDFSRFTWVFYMHKKSETADILKTFITKIKNQFDLKVKVMRSDNGTEFRKENFDSFCAGKRIDR